MYEQDIGREEARLVKMTQENKDECNLKHQVRITDMRPLYHNCRPIPLFQCHLEEEGLKERKKGKKEQYWGRRKRIEKERGELGKKERKELRKRERTVLGKKEKEILSLAHNLSLD